MSEKTPLELLNEAAEKYAQDLIDVKSGEPHQKTWIESIYGQGALSTEAANGCNKHVEKAKIEFAMQILNRAKDLDLQTVYSELKTKLKEYE